MENVTVPLCLLVLIWTFVNPNRIVLNKGLLETNQEKIYLQSVNMNENKIQIILGFETVPF